MNKVAETASDTALARVESAAGFPKVCDGREFAVDGTTGVPTRIEGVTGGLGAVLVLEARIYVSDKVCRADRVSEK